MGGRGDVEGDEAVVVVARLRPVDGLERHAEVALVDVGAGLGLGVADDGGAAALARPEVAVGLVLAGPAVVRGAGRADGDVGGAVLGRLDLGGLAVRARVGLLARRGAIGRGVVDQRVGPLVDVVVTLHREVHCVLVEQRGELGADAAVGAVPVAGRERALVVEGDDEVDPGVAPPGRQPVLQPAHLGALAVVEQPLDLPAQLVRVDADDPHVAVREAVDRGAAGRAGRRQVQPLLDPAVAVRLVVVDGGPVRRDVRGEQLGVVVAGREHPRDAGRARLDHREPAGPDPRVVVVPAAAVGGRLRRVLARRLAAVWAVGVDDRLDVALRLRVAEVARLQVEPGRGVVGEVANLGDLPDHGVGRVDSGPGGIVRIIGTERSVVPHSPVRLGQQRGVTVQGGARDALIAERGKGEWLGDLARRGDEGGVGGHADLAPGRVAEAVVVLGAGGQPVHVRVHEELVGVERAGRLERAGLAVPDRDVGQQLADLRLDRVPVGAVPAVLEPHAHRPRWHGVVLVQVEQLGAGPHLGARIVAERQMTPVDDEPARHRPGAVEGGRDRLLRPVAGAQQQAARGRADCAAHDRPAADDVAAQVRHPLLVLLGERTLLTGAARYFHDHHCQLSALPPDDAPVNNRGHTSKNQIPSIERTVATLG